MLDSIPQVHAIVGSVRKTTPLSGGFSGDKVYLVNDAFVFKRFKTYNPSAVATQKKPLKEALPQIYYMKNPKERLVLMDFVRGCPIPRDQHTITRLAQFLKKLHQMKPKQGILRRDSFEVIQNVFQFLQDEKVSQEILEKFTRLIALQRHEKRDLTICHNDLNPNNLLFFNNKVVAIDWDASGLNDPYYDLATITMWYINVPDVEKNLLQQYLDSDPTKKELTHLHLMKKVAMAVVGGKLIKAGIQMGCKVKPTIPRGSFSEFLTKIGKREVMLNSGKTLYEFGLILLNEF